MRISILCLMLCINFFARAHSIDFLDNYTSVIENTKNCDGTISVDFDIHETSAGIDTVTACESFMWINGQTYISSNTTAQHVLTNSNGGDSVVTLNLTLITIDDGIGMMGNNLKVNEPNATYQWKNCDTGIPIIDATAQIFSPTMEGNYAVEITKNGCTKTSSCFEYQILNNPMGVVLP